jgi:hypothetical protein
MATYQRRIATPWRLRRAYVLALLPAWFIPVPVLAIDSPYLYGIHWWGYTPGQPIDTNPATLLDCPTYGGWDVETVLTHSDAWWQPSYFTGLYQDLYTNKNMTIITRIDYKWGTTVPPPSDANYAGWPSACVNAVNTVRHGSHIWIIGNEPNVTVEGNDWPGQHILPADYAVIYRNVRNAIRSSAQASPAGEHIVLVAAPSPGGAAGVRWMDGNQWLGQVIDNIPVNEIDGFAMHAYGGTVTDFHNSYVSQLNLIDSKGLQSRPVYVTEWNKVSTEAAMAQFSRDSFSDLNTWNQGAGHHNIRCLCWFIYDADQQAAGGNWNSFSIEYYRGTDEPLGSSSDLYTAFQQTVDLRYPAGVVGVRAAGPVIQRSPDSFTRQVYERDSLPDDTFTVWNGGIGTLNYTITDDANWLSVNPTGGSSTGEQDTIAIQYQTGALPIGGPYTATITISDPNSVNKTQTVTVSLTVVHSPYAAPDFNRDGYVEQTDFNHLYGCMTGSNAGPPASGCQDADIDRDGDVDQDDFGLLQRCLSGFGVLADPACAD